MRNILVLITLFLHSLSLHAMSSSSADPEWAQPPQKSSPENTAELTLQKFLALIKQHYNQEEIKQIHNNVQQSHKDERFNAWTKAFNEFHTKTRYNNSQAAPKGIQYLSDRGEFIEAIQQLFNNKKS